MDFEEMLQDDMDEVAKRVEAGLEKTDAPTNFSKEELEYMIRSVVKEELATAIKDIKNFIEKKMEMCMNNRESDVVNQTILQSYEVKPGIKFSKKVAYDIKNEAHFYGSMTCGGWTFFPNAKEGGHLWAVSENGLEYCELYPKTINRVEKIEDGYVYFSDADYNHFRVCINSGKVESVAKY